MRRVRRKGGNKDKVFGCDLLEHLAASNQEIPQVLQYCSEFVEKQGIVDGIYRLSGVSSNIQKLRGEFESEGTPDLHKDVYLQDIHCVSSLCKAYFRELPNPLLTYQLYDKFAEAVAIQLEEDRLVKIRDVLQELPAPHYRTLEFLMRHLVRMASYCSETNMHSRNLAIVWAPNLLRSKDIEASGFNGTAAFMEVRVQSIVVEFILNHVPQLFPEQGASNERRKSLPSPSAISNQEEGFFKSSSMKPLHNFGNISPGDGPLAMRPYHSIIEGTDKRKGSLKGRKWMSIFNIGGRFQDNRRRHKHSAKEKDRPALRPARSMDSLSTPPYPNEVSRRTGQRPPSTKLSPLVTPSPNSGSEVTASAGAIGGSEYAVTYRRGTGLVSGGSGTQGTYTSFGSEGLGVTGNKTQSRSPGLSTKVGRRAAMHITGPTTVTVPLHITSNLALGVLQGGGGDRVIHRGRDKDAGDRVEGREGGEKVERSESRGMEKKVEESRKVEEEEKNSSEKVTGKKGVAEAAWNTVAGGGGEEEREVQKEEEEKEEEEEEVREECSCKPELEDVPREERASNTEGDTAVGDDKDGDDYMDRASFPDMKGLKPADCEPVVTSPAGDCVFDASDLHNSTAVEGDDQEMSGYVQDNFEFLDQMDCMDSSVSYQVTEFSVEPPGYSDDEYEVMVQARPSSHPAELQTDLPPAPQTRTQSQAELNPHRPLSLDSHNRHTKSLSLPYMTSPIHGPEESCSEEEAAVEDSDDNDVSSEEDESMFVKSLPPDFFLNNLSFEPDTHEQDSCNLDGVPAHQSQSSADRGCQSLNFAFSARKESTVGDLEQVEGKDKGENDALQEKEITKKEEEAHWGREQLENNRQREATEEDVMEDPPSDKEQSLTPEASTHCCEDFPLPSDDESSTVADLKAEEEEEADVFDDHHSDYPPRHDVPEETDDVSLEENGDFSVRATEQPQTCDTKEGDGDEGEDREVYKDTEDVCPGMVLEIKERDDDMWEETTEGGVEVIAEEKHEEMMQGGDIEHDGAICRTGGDIWVELEDVICELIEDKESKQVEAKGARESVGGEGDTIGDVGVGEEEEQVAEISGEGTVEVDVEVDEEDTNETEVREEVAEESMETDEETLTDAEMQQEFGEQETNGRLIETCDPEQAIDGKDAVNEEAQQHDRVDKENHDKERAAEQRRTPPSVDERLKEVRRDVEESKEGRKGEGSASSQGGVGRKLVISKNPRVYQVKAVPVVPPKPQHCKITALTLRQQQQQRDADRERENTGRVPAEQGRGCEGDGEDDGGGRKEPPTPRGGEKGERDRRRDGEERDARDTSTNSPLSMCFDEAVAIATMRRGKEKECEKEKERQKDRANEVQ
ncbi:rho GTPase-activating protein 30 isoform X1 [Perca flavescens]|uniref:rho GTPase-activating protein 30 isoform X1 n=1 Tax=Perca flavescens TaxID=8167 RepID=UPI00106EA14F|nr:rho GTPase-activating protein 30-like isoform X1 [Perca flavescens]XP_028450224.1 rho GTPase-activating protein 30-like isoform X1 [Perca flavescens]